MSGESAFIALMREMATHPGARGLMDDAAVLESTGEPLVITHDMLVEGVHYLPNDPAGAVAWKLVAVNMSDLAAKGATPLGVMLGYSLTGDDAWDEGFAKGLKGALEHFEAPLMGGDTVAIPPGAPRTLGLTAFGAAPPAGAPSRAGVRPGDLIFVSGTIGDAGAGLAILRKTPSAHGNDDDSRNALIHAFRFPMPNLELGRALAPLVSAMADISDGLMIDADRIARASGCAIDLEIAEIPLSPAYLSVCGDDEEAYMSAATAGDDYRLLFTAPEENVAAIAIIAKAIGEPITAVGRCRAGKGLTAHMAGREIPLPDRLGYEHKAPSGNATH